VSDDEERNLRVAVVQFEPVPDQPARNLSVVHRLTLDAVGNGARLVVFPELCLLGYWHLRRHTADRLHALAEHEAIASGSSYTVFDTPWDVWMGVLICWDNNLVENVLATALLGATVLLAPHQTGGTNSRSPHGMKPIPAEIWERRATNPAAVEEGFNGPNGRGWLLRRLPARAHDNGMFVLFSNGVGRDDDEFRRSEDEGGGDRRDAFAAPGETEAVRRRRADRDVGVAGGAHRLLGLGPAGREPGPVADHLDGDVADLEPGGAHPPGCLRQQRSTRSTCPLGHRGAEVRSEVAELRRGEQGVTSRVRSDVAIGVP
jgi:predicted amidohydrolase